MTPEVLTFGCRLNAYESEVMRGLAADQPETIIVNTCAVTAEAERQARKAIRRAHRDRPGARIVVTGCAAQINPAAWSALPGVARVLGNADKLRPESWQPGAPSAVSSMATTPPAPPPALTEFTNRARALVQVQAGCDHRCTFCVIPQGRGPSRSVPPGPVVDQVRALVGPHFDRVPHLDREGLPGRDRVGRRSVQAVAAGPAMAEPAPGCTQAGHQHDGGSAGEMAGQPLPAAGQQSVNPQPGWDRLVELGLQRAGKGLALGVVAVQPRGLVRVRVQVGLDKGSPFRRQLAVNEGLQVVLADRDAGRLRVGHFTLLRSGRAGRRSPSSSRRNCSRARLRRDITVPTGMSSTCATPA